MWSAIGLLVAAAPAARVAVAPLMRYPNASATAIASVAHGDL